jgi:hypothetical protein
MFRLAILVLAMSKPLAGVNSPAMLLGKVKSDMAVVSLGSRPASSWAPATEGRVAMAPKTAMSPAPAVHSQGCRAVVVAGRIRFLR